MTMEEIEFFLNKLLANEYIKNITLGGQFQNLGITPKGVTYGAFVSLLKLTLINVISTIFGGTSPLYFSNMIHFPIRIV